MMSPREHGGMMAATTTPRHGEQPSAAVRVLRRCDAAGFDPVGIALAAVVTALVLIRWWASTGPVPLVGPLAVLVAVATMSVRERRRPVHHEL